MSIQNPIILSHSSFADMYQDSYFPKHLVDQLKQTLLDLCQQIEAQKPQNLDALYIFTHVATEHINVLQDAFDEAESEIETVARESIGSDIYFIAQSYGFVDADQEELISPRDW